MPLIISATILTIGDCSVNQATCRNALLKTSFRWRWDSHMAYENYKHNHTFDSRTRNCKNEERGRAGRMARAKVLEVLLSFSSNCNFPIQRILHSCSCHLLSSDSCLFPSLSLYCQPFINLNKIRTKLAIIIHYLLE